MAWAEMEDRGLVLLGCGKMGAAMLAGWLEAGLDPKAVHVIDPAPSDWLLAKGVSINGTLPDNPAVALIAVKPQVMLAALPRLTAFAGGDTAFISIAAGTSIATFEKALGAATPVVRAMPNTPAAIAKGITAIVSNAAGKASLDLAEALLSAIGTVVRLDTEAQMDAVTAVSGSGPAYVFHMIEALTAAAAAEGLPPQLAERLAIATVAGAGALAEAADDSPETLRVNVTSPNGTTAAGLSVLMAPDTGLMPLVRATVAAARQRSEELGRE